MGSNFYLEEKDVGSRSRADACISKLQELNPYVKVSVLPNEAALTAALNSGEVHVVCQTELSIGGKFHDPSSLDQTCRAKGIGFISSATLGPWGYAFLDFGEKHVITDHDGEQTKQFIVTMIEKGKETTVTVHEDKRHSYQEGDYVVFREVEGMSQINDLPPAKICKTTTFTFTIELDSSAFGDYSRQGVVENIKVPKEVSYHTWDQSFRNPVASTANGFFEPPDLAKFGRSDQLHAALLGIVEFLKSKGRYPQAADLDETLKLAEARMKEN